MDNRSHELFNDSLQRTGQDQDPRFLNRFYELFLGASPEIRAKFEGVDMSVQRSMLKASLYMLLLGAQGRPEGVGHLTEVARRHGRRGLDVPERLYDLWLQCLLQAVAEFDPAYDAQVEAAWRAVLSYGIDFMKRHARDA